MSRYQASAARSRWVGAASVALALGVSGLPSVNPSRAQPAHAQAAVHRLPHTARASTILASSARTASVNDTGHLRLMNASGAVLNEAGPVTGSLPGRVRVRLVVRANVTASFTIETRGGSIVGHGSAVLHSSREYSSFGGSLSVDRGTGRYAHAGGGGRLYGVIDRSNDALTVQTVGALHY
jgi:hypothetical protein